MSGAVLAIKLAQSERMCPTDTQQHTQRQSADPTGMRHRGSAEKQEAGPQKKNNMAHRQTAKCCIVKYGTMDRNIQGMIVGKEKRGQRMGEGGFSNSRAVVTWCVANAVPERGGKRMNPDKANKNRTFYKERTIYKNIGGPQSPWRKQESY